MKIVLDANALIYMSKTNLLEFFRKLIMHEINIDTSVYSEVVEKGMDLGYDDAKNVKTFLENNKIPIIPINIETKLHVMKDPGETSCLLLTSEEDLCISSDIRAYKKFKKNRKNVLYLDSFFLKKAIDKKLTRNQLEEILEKLMTVYATTTERMLQIMKKYDRMKN